MKLGSNRQGSTDSEVREPIGPDWSDNFNFRLDLVRPGSSFQFFADQVRGFSFILVPVRSGLTLHFVSVLARSDPGFHKFCSALFHSGLVQSGTVRFWTVDTDDKNSSHQILPMEFLSCISPMEFILEIFIHNKISKHVTKL